MVRSVRQGSLQRPIFSRLAPPRRDEFGCETVSAIATKVMAQKKGDNSWAG